MDGTLINQEIRLWLKSWHLVFRNDCNRTLLRLTSIFKTETCWCNEKYRLKRSTKFIKQIFIIIQKFRWLLFKERSKKKMVSNRVVESRFFKQHKKWLKAKTKSCKNAQINEKTFTIIYNKNSKGLIFFLILFLKRNLSLNWEAVNK